MAYSKTPGSGVPLPPRRPKTAYFLFTANERPTAKQEYPTYGFGELGKVLGDKWAKLPEAEKSKYKEEATKAMEKYKREISEWKQQYPQEAANVNAARKRKRESKAEKKKKKSKKQKKDPNAPKRAMSAFMFYSKDHRARIQEENQGVSFGDTGKILGQKWKELPDDEREKYTKKANEDRERYHRESENYKETKKQPEESSSNSEDDDDDDSE